ncbi:MAG TPA: radical SAM protein [Terriglobales bacterium]|nr:radical SAM protein [Terriglobales bacterium]
MAPVAVVMPNGALTSLAGNIDAHHKVAIADLVLVQDRVRSTVESLVREHRPDVVGLSIMTFQRRTAARIIALMRSLKPDVKIVVGGYDPSLAPEAYMQPALEAHPEPERDGARLQCPSGSPTNDCHPDRSRAFRGGTEGPRVSADTATPPSDPTVSGVDFIVRGEGEVTFRDLLRALENPEHDFANISGLTWRASSSSHLTEANTGDCPTQAKTGLEWATITSSKNPTVQSSHRPQSSAHPFIRSCDDWVVNPDRPVHSLDSGEIKLPNRSARVLHGYHMLGRQVDVVETSRGCTYDCSFCSIIEMRGRNFHTYTFDRVLADIRDARDHGARSIFLVDDNITLNVRRFEALCQAIIDAKLDDIDYTVQAMTSAIATHGETLAPLMRRAGFRYVFLGIENILDGDLAFLKAAAKNADRDNGRTVGNATLKAIDYIHRNKMYVVGGLIVGNPDDTPESIEENLRFASKYVDWPYIQHPTPYPRTPMTKDFVERNLIINSRLHEYDGTTAVVKTDSVDAEQIEFMRWRAERWMKLRHIPAAIRHDPWFILRNWPKMLAYTFRGSSIRSALGLESEQQVFRRYKARRQAEREYV